MRSAAALALECQAWLLTKVFAAQGEHIEPTAVNRDVHFAEVRDAAKHATSHQLTHQALSVDFIEGAADGIAIEGYSALAYDTV